MVLKVESRCGATLIICLSPFCAVRITDQTPKRIVCLRWLWKQNGVFLVSIKLPSPEGTHYSSIIFVQKNHLDSSLKNLNFQSRRHNKMLELYLSANHRYVSFVFFYNTCDNMFYVTFKRPCREVKRLAVAWHLSPTAANETTVWDHFNQKNSSFEQLLGCTRTTLLWLSTGTRTTWLGLGKDQWQFQMSHRLQSSGLKSCVWPST